MERLIRQLIERDLVEHNDDANAAHSTIARSRNGLLRRDAYCRMLLGRHFQV